MFYVLFDTPFLLRNVSFLLFISYRMCLNSFKEEDILSFKHFLVQLRWDAFVEEFLGGMLQN